MFIPPKSAEEQVIREVLIWKRRIGAKGRISVWGDGGQWRLNGMLYCGAHPIAVSPLHRLAPPVSPFKETSVVLNLRMFTKPGILLRIEGGCVLALSILSYREIDASWILFLALFLVPDLAILGYLGGTRIGTILYNLVHTLIGPFLLIAYAVPVKSFWLLPYGLIWSAHIGIDRLLGFGLKYPTRFKDTHLQRV